ncbi:hypothetical protein ABH960_000273 [Bacillus sp. RC252]
MEFLSFDWRKRLFIELSKVFTELKQFMKAYFIRLLTIFVKNMKYTLVFLYKDNAYNEY